LDFRDWKKSAKWYLSAARGGSSNAAFMLSQFPSYHKEWFEKALNKKNKYALAHVEKTKRFCKHLNSEGMNFDRDKCFQKSIISYEYSKKPKSANVNQVFSNEMPKCKGSPFTSSDNYLEWPEWSDCIGDFSYKGNKYVGEWWEGRPHGKGTATRADGTVQTGTWKNGNPVNESEKNSSIELKKKNQLVG
jgi:hypothetical protein